jgi:hypothetical protein
MMKRSTYLKYDEKIELGKRGLTVWAYRPKEKYVCRVQINAAGIAVYTGKKGGKRVADVNWESLVERLSKQI